MGPPTLRYQGNVDGPFVPRPFVPQGVYPGAQVRGSLQLGLVVATVLVKEALM